MDDEGGCSPKGGGGAPQPEYYEAKIYNFYVFPRPIKDSGLTIAPKVKLDADAVHFNRCHGCDFGTWLADGITYVNAQQEQDVERSVYSFRSWGDEKALLHADDAKRAKAELDAINTWLKEGRSAARAAPVSSAFAAGSTSSASAFDKEYDGDDITRREKYYLGPCKLSHRYMKYLAGVLRLPPYSEQLLLVKEANPLGGCRDPELFAVRLDPAKGYTRERALQEAEVLNRRTIDGYLGFRRLWRHLKQVKCPVSFHNGLLDVLYIAKAFEAPLPDSYAQFCALVKEQVFPNATIYDTKLLTTNL